MRGIFVLVYLLRKFLVLGLLLPRGGGCVPQLLSALFLSETGWAGGASSWFVLIWLVCWSMGGFMMGVDVTASFCRLVVKLRGGCSIDGDPGKILSDSSKEGQVRWVEVLASGSTGERTSLCWV